MAFNSKRTNINTMDKGTPMPEKQETYNDIHVTSSLDLTQCVAGIFGIMDNSLLGSRIPTQTSLINSHGGRYNVN